MSVISIKMNSYLLMIGFLLLLIQNALLLLSYPVPIYSDDFPLFTIALFVDLLAFLLIGAGFIFYSKQESVDDNRFFKGGLFILGWLTLRIIWQFSVILGVVNYPGEYGATFPASIISTLVPACLGIQMLGIYVFDYTWTIANLLLYVLFFLSSISLAIGSMFIYRARKKISGKSSFMVFSLINALVISFFFIEISLKILSGYLVLGSSCKSYRQAGISNYLSFFLYPVKLYIVPFLAIITSIIFIIGNRKKLILQDDPDLSSIEGNINKNLIFILIIIIIIIIIYYFFLFGYYYWILLLLLLLLLFGYYFSRNSK